MGLAVVQSNSLGGAYKLLSQLNASQQPYVYDLVPQGFGATLLIRSDRKAVELLIEKNSEQLSLESFIDSEDEAILRALYSIEYAPLQEGVLVAEGPKSSDLLSVAFLAAQEGLPLVDLKIPRGAQPGGHLLVTGPASKLADFGSRVEKSYRALLVTQMPVTDSLARFFDVSPKS